MEQSAQEKERQAKIAHYEKFIDEVLKRDLEKILNERDKLFENLAQ